MKKNKKKSSGIFWIVILICSLLGITAFVLHFVNKKKCKEGYTTTPKISSHDSAIQREALQHSLPRLGADPPPIPEGLDGWDNIFFSWDGLHRRSFIHTYSGGAHAPPRGFSAPDMIRLLVLIMEEFNYTLSLRQAIHTVVERNITELWAGNPLPDYFNNNISNFRGFLIRLLGEGLNWLTDGARDAELLGRWERGGTGDAFEYFIRQPWWERRITLPINIASFQNTSFVYGDVEIFRPLIWILLQIMTPTTDPDMPHIITTDPRLFELLWRIMYDITMNPHTEFLIGRPVSTFDPPTTPLPPADPQPPISPGEPLPDRYIRWIRVIYLVIRRGNVSRTYPGPILGETGNFFVRTLAAISTQQTVLRNRTPQDPPPEPSPSPSSPGYRCRRGDFITMPRESPLKCPDASYNPPTCLYFDYLTGDVAAKYIATIVSDPDMSFPYIGETRLGFDKFKDIIDEIPLDTHYNPSSNKNDLVNNIVDNIEYIVPCEGNKSYYNAFWGIPWPVPSIIPTPEPPIYNHFMSLIFKILDPTNPYHVDEKILIPQLKARLRWKDMIPSSIIPGDPNQNAYLNMASIRSWAIEFSTYLTKNLRHDYGTHPNSDCSNGITVSIPPGTQVINKNMGKIDSSIVNADGSLKQTTTVCANLNDINTVRDASFDTSGNANIIGVRCPPGLGMNYLTGTCNVRCDCFSASGETVCYYNDGSGSVCKPQIEEGCPTYNQRDSSGILHSYPYMATL